MNYGWLSLLPPLLAVIFAVKSKNVIISLFLGGFIGTMILTACNPVKSVTSLIGDYYFVQLTDSYNAGVIVLLIFIGGFIKLMEKSGGAHAFAKSVTGFINTKAKAQLSAWFGGIVVFFSDLGTPLIVGPIFEPVFDKMKISREKLAWVLDSTSSPVAILVPFIGWGVYIMGLIQTEFDVLAVEMTDYTAFVKAIPFQLYALLAIIMIPVVALTKLDFSQMRKAEKRVEETGEIYWPSSNPTRERPSASDISPNSRTSMVLLPLVVLFVTLFGLLAPLGFPFQKVDGNAFRIALTTAYFFAGLVLIAMMVLFKVKSFKETFQIYVTGMKGMNDVAITLILAWTLGAIIKQLGTADYLINIMKATNISSALIPAIVFLFGACVSFATGSSWGTFAIMMPLAIPMGAAFDMPLYICIGAVLSGGLFGDHCSPISDTTILSSTGAGCDLVDHVKTQLPYAVTNGVIALVGYLIAGVTKNMICLPVVIVLLIGAIILFSRLQDKSAGRA